jgi:hypothetical protein
MHDCLIARDTGSAITLGGTYTDDDMILLNNILSGKILGLTYKGTTYNNISELNS